MAGVTCQGDLWIEMNEFWVWVETQGSNLDGPMTPSFSVKDDAIVLTTKDGNRSFIDSALFWIWINKEHLPKSFNHAETLYGVPQFQGAHTLRVQFATSDDGSPAGWAKPPDFLQEWKTA